VRSPQIFLSPLAPRLFPRSPLFSKLGVFPSNWKRGARRLRSVCQAEGTPLKTRRPNPRISSHPPLEFGPDAARRPSRAGILTPSHHSRARSLYGGKAVLFEFFFIDVFLRPRILG